MELRYREAPMETHLMARIPHEPEFLDKQHRLLEPDPHKWGDEALITARAGLGLAARHLALGIGRGIPLQQATQPCGCARVRWSRIHAGGP